jgi:hypothetical protein
VRGCDDRTGSCFPLLARLCLATVVPAEHSVAQCVPVGWDDHSALVTMVCAGQLEGGALPAWALIGSPSFKIQAVGRKEWDLAVMRQALGAFQTIGDEQEMSEVER